MKSRKKDGRKDGRIEGRIEGRKKEEERKTNWGGGEESVGVNAKRGRQEAGRGRMWKRKTMRREMEKATHGPRMSLFSRVHATL